MKSLRKLLAGSFLLVLLAPQAAKADLAADCNQPSNLERQVRACSILIEDRRMELSNTVIAHINRGNAYGRLKRYAEALNDYAAAIALSPDDALAYYNRGNVHFDLGNSNDAIADYSRVIALSPNFALAYFNRGLVREQQGDRAGAIEDYDHVLLLEPTARKARARLQSLKAGPR